MTTKIGSGSRGFGFWADLSRDLPEAATQAPPDVSLYHPETTAFDPYEYHYW